jgi:hypothetical protein
MTPQECKPYNDLLLELYQKSQQTDPWIRASGWKEKGMIDLLRDDLVLYRDRTEIGGANYMIFALSQAGKILIDQSTAEFTLDPYGLHLKQKSEKQALEKDQIDKANAKLVFDLKNAERVYRSYWWTFGLAIISFVVSLILAILKIAEKKP